MGANKVRYMISARFFVFLFIFIYKKKEKNNHPCDERGLAWVAGHELLLLIEEHSLIIIEREHY